MLDCGPCFQANLSSLHWCKSKFGLHGILHFLTLERFLGSLVPHQGLKPGASQEKLGSTEVDLFETSGQVFCQLDEFSIVVGNSPRRFRVVPIQRLNWFL